MHLVIYLDLYYNDYFREKVIFRYACVNIVWLLAVNIC